MLPTPAVAYLVRKYNADAGVVISASHNPMEFNGIKIFAGSGYKLPDEVENQIEAYIDNDCAGIRLMTGDDVGRVYRRDDGLQDYVDYLYQAIHGDLSGLNVCIDCANGASAVVAQKLFPRLAPSAPSWASARTARTSTRVWAVRIWTIWKKPWWPAVLTAASPLTAMPTAALPATRRAARWTATRSLPCWP